MLFKMLSKKNSKQKNTSGLKDCRDDLKKIQNDSYSQRVPRITKPHKPWLLFLLARQEFVQFE